MQTNESIKDLLTSQWKHGGMTVRLIGLNGVIFILIQLCFILTRLISPEWQLSVTSYLNTIFALPTGFNGFIRAPWTLITSIFAHFSFLHILMNLLFLYFSGKLFESLFDSKRLLHTYIIGGVFGGVFELVAHLVFPALQQQSSVIVGASGSVMALFVAIAIYRPNLTVNIFGLFPIRLIFLALLFVLSDFLSLGNKDSTAHFAHLGGALLGFISVQNIYSKRNIIQLSIQLFDRISLFKGLKKGVKMKVNRTRTATFKSDEDYNLEKTQKQEKTDAILDKIAKSGYDSLTKAEKEFLFKQSENG